MKKSIRFFSSLFLIAIICLIPIVALASSDVVVTTSISTESLKDTYEAGDEIVVNIDLTTCGNNVGVIKGFLSFDKEKLDIKKIKKGGLSPNILAQGEDGTSYGEDDHSSEIMYWVEDEYDELETGSIGTVTFTVKEDVAGSISFQITNLTATTYNNQTSYTTEGVNSVERTIITNPTKPTITATNVAYTGLEQTAVVANFDADTMLISGDKKTNAGTYTITVTPKTGKWKDGTSASVSCEWTINKVQITPNVTISEREYIKNDTSATISNVSFDGLVNNEALVSTTDYTATAEFTSDNAGSNKDVNVTISLVENEKTANYELENTVYNFKGTINPVEIEDFELEYSTTEFTGEELKPTVTIDGLTENTDFEVEYSENVNVGIATITVTGKGNYNGEKEGTFTITPKVIMPTVDDVDSVTYNGCEQKPTLTIKDGSVTLQDTDYNVNYSNNINVGTAVATITLKGNYSGDTSKEFEITTAPVTPSITASNKNYDGTTDAETVVHFSGLCGNDNFIKDTDYSINTSSFSDANVGNNKTVTVDLTLLSNDKTKNYYFTGTTPTTSANIIAAALPKTATLEYSTTEYTGEEMKPSVTIDGLILGTDFSVEYADNTNAGTATVIITGIGNYDGTDERKFTITAKSINPSVDEIADQEYTGEEIEPSVVVKNGTSTLVENTDYEVSYSNNTNVTTNAKAIVKPKNGGNYTFTNVEATFNINPYTLQDSDVALEKSSYKVTGSEIKPVVTVSVNGTILTSGDDYTVTYSDNIEVSDIAPKVTVTGQGNYDGVVNKGFSITEKDTQEISFNNATINKIYGDSSFTIEANHSVGDGDVIYSSSSGDVATVNSSTGKVTILKSGSTQITATASETADYTETSCTYILTVSKKAISATAEVSDKNYDGTTSVDLDNLEVSFSGLVSNDNFVLDTDYEVTSCSFADAIAGDNKTVNVSINMISTSVTDNYVVEETTLSTTASILPIELPEAELEYATHEYTGEALQPTVSFDDDNITANDYSVTYENNTNVGTAKVKVSGVGNYKGTQEFEFSITAVNKQVIIADIDDVKYNGESQNPSLNVSASGENLTFVLDKDYEVVYENNVNVGTAKAKVTLKGNYQGSAEKEFNILKATISNAKANNLSQKEGNVTAVTYTTTPTITDGNAKVLYEVDAVVESESDGMTVNTKAYTETLPTKSGSYKVKLVLAGDSNIEDGEFDLGTLIISKKSSGGSSSGGGGGSSSSYKITTKIENGTITPANTSIKKNGEQEFTFEANKGYEITDVLIDGKSIGAVKSYKMEKVTEKHTIEVKTQKASILTNVDEWAKQEMVKADEKGLIPETFANKDASKAITRTEFAAVAVKLYEAISGKKAEKTTSNPFTDTNDEYVLKAYALGITNGTSETTFTPNMEITREQMATMLTRALTKAGINTEYDITYATRFADDSELSDWGRPSVYFMAKEEIIKGIGNNRFNGLGNAKVEEAIAIALRSVDVYTK